MEEPRSEEQDQVPQNSEVVVDQEVEKPASTSRFEKFRSKKILIGALILFLFLAGAGGVYVLDSRSSVSQKEEAVISESPTLTPEPTSELTPTTNPAIASTAIKSVSPTTGLSPTPSTAIINVKIQDDRTRKTLTDSGFEIYINSSENNYTNISRSNEATFSNLKPGNYDVSVNAPTSFFHRESGCGDGCGTSISNENKCAIRMHVGGGGTINMYCTYDRF